TGLHTVYYEFLGDGISVANIHSFVFNCTENPNFGVGEIENTFAPDSLTTTLKYQNETDETQNLTLLTAIYKDDGKLAYVGSSSLEIAPSEIVDFETIIEQEGLQAECVDNNYSIGVF